MTDVAIGVVPGPPTDVWGDTEAQVREKGAMTMIRIFPSQGDPHDKYQTSRSLSWKMLIGRNLRLGYELGLILTRLPSRDFVYHIENSFRDRGLRTDVLILSPRISLTAVVRRQIIEGVLAIVKLSRSNQFSGKIPLQVFDRTGGIDNVKFNGEILPQKVEFM